MSDLLHLQHVYFCHGGIKVRIIIDQYLSQVGTMLREMKTLCEQRAVVSTCVRKKPGLSHPTSAARKPRKAREERDMGGRNWLIYYLPVECANPRLEISMGKPFSHLLSIHRRFASSAEGNQLPFERIR